MLVENIKIGKNILENLTVAMYKDSRFIYREYIQNAADAVDDAIKQNILTPQDARIDIDIDPAKRSIIIEDNATGISKDKVAKSLGHIADSLKDKKTNKGFRGIGRLGGLAYCEKLIFETSYLGENVKTTMTLDGKLLQEILNDASDKSDAITVVQRISSISEDIEDCSEHYFRVKLQKVSENHNVLLDKAEIREYLGMIAPVPFERTKFFICSDIYKYLNENNVGLDEYNIRINGENLYKIYQMSLLDANERKKYDEIHGVEIHEFYNSKNELLAWSWIGLSRFDKQIPEKNNPQRNIRLKKQNIQFGDNTALNDFHFEQSGRGNGYFIGEVHAVHEDLIPNARRDYFNENAALREFEKELTKYFHKIYKLYRHANTAKNAIKHQNTYKEVQQEYVKKSKSGSFISNEEKEKFIKKIEEAKERAEKAQKELIKIENKLPENKTLEKVFDNIKNEYANDAEASVVEVENIVRLEEEPAKQKLKSFRSDNLIKLKKAERKLISEVYTIIHSVLDPETAENVIRKIEEKYT